MIDYERDLNEAQYDAATSVDGPLLVVAGAGSGKTRTIVYRLAYLVETGIPASAILLLTFTRKAAAEMLERARRLVEQDAGLPDLAAYGNGFPGNARGQPCPGEIPAGRCAQGPDAVLPRPLAYVQGGTFHSYAYSILRLFRPQGYNGNLTVMDNHDMLAALQHCREALKISDRSFPKNQTVIALLSKSRNKEIALEDALRRNAAHLLVHHTAMADMAAAYARYKREKSLLDYDDLLFCLEETLLARPEALAYCRGRHKYIMVDEYQDTNPVQARIAGLIAGLGPAGSNAAGNAETFKADQDPTSPGAAGNDETFKADPHPTSPPAAGNTETFNGNIMAVGDDAQSIYAFRGADIRNILNFPETFKGAKIIRLEENYRSTQHLLNLSNAVLENAAEGYAKHLFTRRGDGLMPNIVRPLSDRSQASHAAARITELMRTFGPGGTAVLFRSGFHSFPLEVTLNKLGIAFKKYGGVRYTEAAHVRDVLSFLRLVLNPMDFTAFTRMAELSKGVGAKTCLKIYQVAASGNKEKLAEATARLPDLAADLAFLEKARHGDLPPVQLLSDIIEHYTPRLQQRFPDDYPRRMQGLEQLVQIASAYNDPDLLAADLSLEDPEKRDDGEACLTLSTIHSAKGLEWDAVLVLDLVEDRFPSRHAMVRPEDYEEERRLMYVACTRARSFLELYVPAGLYDRSGGGALPASPSPFVRELHPSLYRELQEGWDGSLVEKRRNAGKASAGLRLARAGDAPAVRAPGAAYPPAESQRAGVSVAGRTGRSAYLAPQGALADLSGHGDGPDHAGHDDGDACTASESPLLGSGDCGFCRHRIFGRGKIVQRLPPDKVRVNFPGFGLKVIMSSYLSMEE
ncbi:MAG: ATP-dependent helicase [Desulfovibrio sp.]|jgi:DNA helicase-2/ATP-dependent DNA helicase PcrA|nr:ATP-dependent helicase [Desulfovibrio sp.]